MRARVIAQWLHESRSIIPYCLPGAGSLVTVAG